MATDGTPPTLKKLVLQTTAAAAALLLVLAVLGALFHEPLKALALEFTDAFGWTGIFLGIFLADSIHFPVLPQVYLLAAVGAELPVFPTLLVACAASLLGGASSYLLGRTLGRHRWLRRYVEHARMRLDPFFARYGYWAVAVGSLTPLPYCTLCFVSGLYHVKAALFGLFILLRIPRMCFFYLIIWAGWSMSP